MCNKGLKAIFSLKCKILDFEFSSIKLKLKLFDTLIRPITTYGSEIWISDFSQKDVINSKIKLRQFSLVFTKHHYFSFCNIDFQLPPK
jgi:hypothetical protein